MDLFNIMDEIAAKQVTKSETGDNRIMGVLIGVVVKNYEEKMPGRICVEIPVRDEDANELKWARLAMPSSGKAWGHYFLPEIGDQVLLAFEQGNIEKPYVIGCVPKDNNPFLKKSVHQKNQIKRIVTKNGSTIRFDDVDAGEQGEPGRQDKIWIFTPGNTHQVLLDNEKGQILISDKDGKNKFLMETGEKGKMTVMAENRLTVKVGDNITLTMNAESGGVSLKCTKLTVEASDSATVKTNGKLGLSGGNVTMEASSMMKVESSSMVSIAGAPIKIG